MTQPQSSAIDASLHARLAAAAQTAGLVIAASEPAVSAAGAPTTRFLLALPSNLQRTLQMELAHSFDASNPEFAPTLATFLAESARRLRNAIPNAILTLSGLPLTYTHFEWPFHESTAGADTSLVHGQVNLQTGEPSILHAKIAASMTVTFREIVPAPEQPFAESFILNAVRKTIDQGQIELVKSGNRQPVPVTTRYFSAKQKKYIFNDTTEAQRRAFLAAKTYWLSGVHSAVLAAASSPDLSSSSPDLSSSNPDLASSSPASSSSPDLSSSSPDLSSFAAGGGSASASPYIPVWLLDPRDAQYLNATVADLKLSFETLAKEGVIAPASEAGFAAPTEALMARREQYEHEVAEALAFIKPTFNESMRGGHTNM